jgi:hypothetical protein
VRLGAVGRVRAERADVSQSVVGGMLADDVRVELGTVGGLIARDVAVSQSRVGSLLAGGPVTLDRTMAGAVVAPNVSLDERSGALIVLAYRVEGNVRALLDPRGAVIFGVVAGLVLAVVGPLLGRGRRGR